VPMVGWKQEPLLAVASWFLVSDKYLHTLCNEMEMMIEYIYLYIYE
jgi:hypothetical protein